MKHAHKQTSMLVTNKYQSEYFAFYVQWVSWDISCYTESVQDRNVFSNLKDGWLNLVLLMEKKNNGFVFHMYFV